MAKRSNWKEMRESAREEKGSILLKEQNGGLNNG